MSSSSCSLHFLAWGYDLASVSDLIWPWNDGLDSLLDRSHGKKKICKVKWLMKKHLFNYAFKNIIPYYYYYY